MTIYTNYLTPSEISQPQQKLYFDLLLLIDVIEHIEDYLGFLRCLKPLSTYKIIHVPLELCIPKVLFDRYLVNSRRKYGHLHYFTKLLAIEAFKKTGHEVIDLFLTNAAIEMASSTSLSIESRMLNLPRRIVALINKDLAAKLFGGYSLMVLLR